MRDRAAELALAFAALVGAAAALAAMTVRHDTTVVRHTRAPGAMSATLADTSAHLGWAQHAPFRRNRIPPATRYDARLSATAVATPSAPKPSLQLRGLVLGAAPAAILEGIPQAEGPTVVRPGDRLAGLTIRSITRSRVTVTGFDTTWTLMLPQEGGR